LGAALTREQYIALIEDRYFANMAAGEPLRSVAMFSAAGVVTARTPGRPPRIARREPAPGEESLDHFFSAILETYSVSYADFWHSVDPAAERVCTAYTITLTPTDPSARPPARELRNANFFQFAGADIDAVLVVGLATEAVIGLG
jgi:hypothetical protein